MSDHTKVAKKIIELEFVEMSEVMMGLTSPRPFPPSRPPIISISQWTERFATLTALLSMQFPLKAPEIFAYLAAVLRQSETIRLDVRQPTTASS